MMRPYVNKRKKLETVSVWFWVFLWGVKPDEKKLFIETVKDCFYEDTNTSDEYIWHTFKGKWDKLNGCQKLQMLVYNLEYEETLMLHYQGRIEERIDIEAIIKSQNEYHPGILSS